MDYIDTVLDVLEGNYFQDDGCHMREDQRLLEQPIQVQMKDGWSVASHMLSQVRKADMCETQEGSLKGALASTVGVSSQKLFEITDVDTGYAIMLGLEDANCCERNCMPSKCRPYRFTLFARASQDALYPTAQLKRGWSCKCFNKEMRIYNPTNNHVYGTIQPKTRCCTMHYDVKDSRGNLAYTVTGGKCQSGAFCGKLPIGPCRRITFTANDSKGRPVGDLANEWAGCCKELCGDADNYVIRFDKMKDPEHKLLLIASNIFIDMRHFSDCGCCNVRDCLIKKYTPKHLAKVVKYGAVGKELKPPKKSQVIAAAVSGAVIVTGSFAWIYRNIISTVFGREKID